MKITLSTSSIDDYRTFLKIKSLPVWSIKGRECWFPDEYADDLGLIAAPESDVSPPSLSSDLFDYQRNISQLAIRKKRFCVFADCGLGKTLIFLEFARHAARLGNRVLIVSPLMVVPQTIAESNRFYPDMTIQQVRAKELGNWLGGDGDQIAITNFEAIKPDLPRGNMGCLIIDESSMLKSHYGKWGTKLIDMGRGIEWKMACTGTPAPNDRIEYANHAVFMDSFPTVNSFLATYFVNRGQTQDRWVIKDHAVEPFYRSLSHWCIFLTDPSTYGWKDNVETVPPIHVHIESIELTADQRSAVKKTTGQLFVTEMGGITQRSKLSQIAKGRNGIKTNKPKHIRSMVDRWPDESTIIWCRYNDEQDRLAKLFPDAANISGSTPHEERLKLIDDFKSGRRKVMISKPKILGFGLNLQVATRQIFSGIDDSYESYYQAVKRSNRYGSTRPLNVHVPVTELEEPFISNVLRKAKMVEDDTRTQERMFFEHGYSRS